VIVKEVVDERRPESPPRWLASRRILRAVVGGAGDGESLQMTRPDTNRLAGLT